MRRAGLRLGLLAILVWVAGSCGRTGFDLPRTNLTVPGLPFGSGADGSRDFGSDAVVNVCEPLLRTTGGAVVVGAWSARAGARVLLLQMQVPLGAPSGDQQPLDPGDAGLWQISQVTGSSAVAGGVRLDLAPAAQHPFSTGTAGRAAQACVMPEFQDVNIQSGTDVRADDWNGETGGVAAFFVAGTLTLGGNVSVSESGFRGGQQGTDAIIEDVTAVDTNDQQGHQKGESLDGTAYGRFGRGNRATGGGGGNGHNAGGGGGANGGAGGYGGYQQIVGADAGMTTNLATRGMPGVALDASVSARLSLGGGGGKGHGNDSNSGDGGSGGGIVLVLASNLAGGGDFLSDGAAGSDSGGSAAGGDADAGGGGGAGGTIFVRVGGGATTWTGRVRARGGAAGNSDLRGPGGGGGGGRVRLEGFSTVPLVDLQGGAAGSDGVTARDSTAGAGGTLE